MKTLFRSITIVAAVLLLLSCACNAKCQEAESIITDTLSEVAEPSLGYINEDDLIQRVDDMTEVLNTHTDQIEELDKQLSDLKTAFADFQSKPAPVYKRNLLGTTLKQPTKLGSGSTGSTGTTTTAAAPSLGSIGAVYTPPPIVTFSQPVMQFSEPIYSQPVSAFPSQQFTNTRTVRRPVQQIRTTNVQYAPVQANQPRLGSRLGNFFGGPGNCPGGICPQ